MLERAEKIGHNRRWSAHEIEGVSRWLKLANDKISFPRLLTLIKNHLKEDLKLFMK